MGRKKIIFQIDLQRQKGLSYLLYTQQIRTPFSFYINNFSHNPNRKINTTMTGKIKLT